MKPKPTAENVAANSVGANFLQILFDQGAFITP